MLPHDCQIITDDMLLTSSHLHVALHVGSLALPPGLSASSLATCTLGVWERGGGVSAGCHHSFGPKSAVAALSRRVSPASPLPPLRLPFSVRWRSHRKSPAVWIRSPNALCQLAVPAVTVEIRLSADVPSVWRRVASPSILKGLPWPPGTGGR